MLGQSYVISCTGYSNGDYVFRLTEAPPPSPLEITPILVLPYTYAGSTAGAQSEVGDCCGGGAALFSLDCAAAAVGNVTLSAFAVRAAAGNSTNPPSRSHARYFSL